MRPSVVRPELRPLTAPAGLDVLRARLAELSDERPPASPMSPRELARYAHGLVTATGVQPGEALTVALSADADAELAAEVAVAAYRRGARLVRVVSDDRLLPAVTRRLRAHDPERTPLVASAKDALVWHEAVQEDSAFLMVNEWRDDPDGLVDQGERANSLRWCLAYWPSPALARAQGFAGPDGERRLAERLLEFTRNGPQDPLDAYDRHIAQLKERAQALDGLELRELELRTPSGTDLTVGLLGASRFQVCDWETVKGKRFACNYPTEEVFTTPDPRRVEGTLVIDVPGELAGLRFRSLRGRFVAGQLTRGDLTVVPADPSLDPEQAADDVYAFLAAHPGALRLGELALVGDDSRVGRRGEQYGITNLDEQLGLHVALGDSYLAGLDEEGGDGLERNVCLDQDGLSLHFDLVLARGTASVAAIDALGRRHVVMEGGTWQPTIMPTTATWEL